MNARPALVFNGSFNGKSLDWEAFGEWLQKNFSEGYSRDLLNYSKRFSHVLFSGEASELLRLSNGVRKMALASLSNLAKFLGIYEDFKRLVKNYGLKWSGGKAEDYLISRIAHTENNGEVLEWVRLVKAEIPQLNVFMDFMVLSGLRLKEALNSYNLIIALAREGRLNEYYNVEAEALEHYRFKGLFMRKSKKVFVSFIPKKLVQEISKQEKVTFYQINNWVRRDKRLKARFSDIREYFASVMTRWLNPAEIDFLQGRVSGSVFMRNYFNPALIDDLRERVFRGLAEIERELAKNS
jgi:intergrase/recombinase